MKTVGIIGAGAAGLCALKHVLSRGLKPVIWEHSSSIGGTWIYTPNVGNDEHGFPIHSSMYNSLKTNLPKEIMGFPDFPFKDNEGGRSFIHHTEVLEYLKDYANHFNLNQLIQFNHHVEWVEPVDTENRFTKWIVTVKDLLKDTVSDIECDGIIVCNGHYSTPRYPDIEHLESFKGTKMHSHAYRVPDPFRNMKVVILGAAASGMDISLEVAEVAQKVYLAHNLPLPIPSELPPNIHQVKGVKSAKENGFILKDDSFVEVDAIIYCTGYEYTFPFLSPSCGISVEDNQVKPLYKHLVNSSFPSMGIIGIPFQICPFPIFDVQAQYLIGCFEDLISVPSASEVMESEYRVRGSKHHFHLLGSKQENYISELCSKLNMEPLSSHFVKIYDIVWYRRIFSLAQYKNFNYTYEREGGDGVKIIETRDGDVLNTSFDLTLNGAKQVFKLLLCHTPSVLRVLFNLGCNKIRNYLI